MRRVLIDRDVHIALTGTHTAALAPTRPCRRLNVMLRGYNVSALCWHEPKTAGRVLKSSFNTCLVCALACRMHSAQQGTASPAAPAFHGKRVSPTRHKQRTYAENIIVSAVCLAQLLNLSVFFKVPLRRPHVI
jgi:hypothetical protein